MYCNDFNLSVGLRCVEGGSEGEEWGGISGVFQVCCCCRWWPRIPICYLSQTPMLVHDGWHPPTFPKSSKEILKISNTFLNRNRKNEGEKSRAERSPLCFIFRSLKRSGFHGSYNYTRFPISFCFRCLLLHLVQSNEQSMAIYSRRNNLMFSSEKFNIYYSF